MNRRTFFKQVAGVCVAAVVAPSVVAEKPLRVLMYKGVPFCYQPDLGQRGQWDSYYNNRLDTIDSELLAKLDAAVAELEFTPPLI